ncbi:MAG: discoidin domain-containing protein [Thermoguttaceae bacterium]
MSRYLLCGAIALLILVPALTGLAETVALDGRGLGRTFEGIGGLSAGAGSRLLMDYPEPQRSELLDFLFKPNYGASLHHLKVEIGGDVNSTEGSEASYARTREEFEHPQPEQFHRGYEWWLMREAKKRNPNIYLDALQWGAPDWIGDKDFPDAGNANDMAWDKRIVRNRKKFFTKDNVDFIAGFIEGAKKYHGLDINYCGTWNESPIGDEWTGPRFDVPWIKLLRKTLDSRGLTGVGIIARDLDGGRDQARTWRIADLMEQDPELKKAVYAAGAHYPGRWTTSVARKCGKPLWASEDCGGWAGLVLSGGNHPGYGGTLGWVEAGALAKTYNLNYIDGKMTKTTICYLIDSYYDALSFANASALKANTPWSGHYEVWLPLWAMAHTAQFAQPGWKYLDGACGLLKQGGSYVSLRSPDDGQYSVIIETGDAKTPQTLAFHVSGGLSTGAVHVWRSNARSQFERQDDVALPGNSFTVKLEPGSIYSLTTTTGQHKGKTEIPPSAEFPMPYRDDFEGSRAGGMAKYFSDQSGTFEVAERPGGGKCLRQTIAQRGIDWDHYPTPNPYTIIGSAKWRNYEVACDAYIERAGCVALFGRIAQSLLSCCDPPHGYWLKVNSDGRWELKAFTKTLKSGTVAFAADRWHKLALRFSGSRIVASIDRVEVQALDEDDLDGFDRGMAGLGSGWNNARFDNFSVREVAGPSRPRRANLALGKKATASSNYSDSFSARFANDGNPATRWNAAVGNEAGAWLEIDFGRPTRFNRIAVRQLDQRIEKYKIQYWDGAGWRDAHSGATADESWRASFPPVQASRVRLLVVSTRNNITASIYEFGVYDDGQ